MSRQDRLQILLSEIIDRLDQFVDHTVANNEIEIRLITMEDTVQSASEYLWDHGLTGDARRLRERANELLCEAVGLHLSNNLASDEPMGEVAHLVEKFGPMPSPTNDPEELQGRQRSLTGRAAQFREIVQGVLTSVEQSPGGRADSGKRSSASGANHADDFRSVIWFGTVYEFTSTQAACVRILWEHWERGTPTIGQDTILELVDSTQNRLDQVFEKGKHAAWSTMITSGKKKGTFQLVEPPK